MKILLAPAEFYFKHGNYHVTYNIITRIRANFTVLCGFVHPDVKKLNVRVIEVGQPFVLYPIKVRIYGSKFKNIDVIHHISPFAIGKDFNLLGIKTEKPFVIGPMEIPHKFFDDELKMFRIPSILRKFANSKIRTLLSIRTMERCDIAICVNEETKRYLRNFVDKDKIKIIPLGVDSKVFKYSKPPNNYEILSVGHHIKRKGFNYLIKAMKEIVTDYPEAKLHLVGKGPQTEKLKLLTKKLGLKKHIIFHGRVSDEKLLELYRNCRVFVHPSLSEGFCHTTLEAMSIGRAVVSTKTAGSGMVDHGKTGFIIPTRDAEAIAKFVLKLFDDYDLTVKMGKKAREIVEEKYDWNIVAKKYYKVYVQLVS